MKQLIIWLLCRCDVCMGRYSMQRHEFLWQFKMTPRKFPTGIFCTLLTPFVFLCMGFKGACLLWANAFHAAKRDVWSLQKPSKWQCVKYI